MSNELKTYTLQELYAHPMEPICWLVEGLLAPGLYFLGGSPKVGKSWLALQLCLAVCRGAPFLGFRTRKSEVLYLALEDGPRRLHARALHLTEEAPAGLHLCGHAPMIGQGLEQQLDQMLAEHPGIKLVIIDTLQKNPGGNRCQPLLQHRLPGCLCFESGGRPERYLYGGCTPSAQAGGQGSFQAAIGNERAERCRRRINRSRPPKTPGRDGYDVSHRTGYRRYGTDAGLFRLPLEPRLLAG